MRNGKCIKAKVDKDGEGWDSQAFNAGMARMPPKRYSGSLKSYFQHAMTGRMREEATTARNLQEGRAMATQGTVREAKV